MRSTCVRFIAAAIGAVALSFTLQQNVIADEPTSPESVDRPDRDSKLKFTVNTTGKSSQIEVDGLDPATVSKIRALLRDGTGAAAKPLTVHVVASDGEVLPPMLGRTSVRAATVVFVPRFPIPAGSTLELQLKMSSTARALGRVKFANAKSQTPLSRVENVYPTSKKLPENHLRFYIHFSQPMSRGNAYKYLSLRKKSGKQIPAPFLELGEELWSPDGKRFTLLLDPGRVKRLLEPRRELGPVLVDGGQYALVISRDWPDADGRRLAQGFVRQFVATGRDDNVPDVAEWDVIAPESNSDESLILRFDEPLDHAMLHRVVQVQDSKGEPLDGKITVSEHGMEWRFRPETPWKSQEYRIRVAAELEDRAGNNLNAPFEVDLKKSPGGSRRRRAFWLKFTPRSQ